MLGAAEAGAGVAEAAVVAGALAEFTVAAADAGVVAGLRGVAAVGGAAAGGADGFAVSFFTVFVRSPAAAGADVIAVSVLAGLGDATDLSVAGSGFFSLSGFADASDMLMVAT